MKVFHRLDEIAGHSGPASVAIGNFDGVHLGHQALIGGLVSHAREAVTRPVALTFFPHPAEVLRPTGKLERLTTTEEKLALLEALGVESTLVQQFDPSLAALAPEVFFDRFLVQGLKARSVHVGDGFVFGRNRSGTVATLAELCAPRGVLLVTQPAVALNDERVSSTRIRRRVLEGDTTGAARMLGRPYFLTGQVQHGHHRGTAMGFPTANLRFPEGKVLPKPGVYVMRVEWQRQRFRAVANLGVRPTFAQDGGSAPALEVHLLDFRSKLYDEHLRVEFFERVRDEQRFSSIDDLKAQIARDVESARASRSFSLG